ncbi:MAG: hypothetical protein ACJ72D_09195 [Marmoricola sp.]
MVEEESYASLGELTASSTDVVTAVALVDPVPAQGYFDTATPVVVQEFKVVEQVKGSNQAGSVLEVSVLARLVNPSTDENGTVLGYDGLGTEYTPGQTYLLYLQKAPVGPWLTPVSTLSGSFRSYAGIGFVKANRANPGIPEVVDLKDARAAAG